ncbi:MAG: anti-sigma factor [Rhodobacteraceae bacterium]|jgi:anti-sigma-K factor RskA|nr:anti-sigma factor [Paracoccaceae bacterium]
MTGDRDIPPPGDFPGDGSGDGPAPDAVLAAEYALGLMDVAEARAFAARLDVDPALRRLVAEWEEGFAPLADAVPPVEPPPNLKARIEAAITPAPVAIPARRSGGWFGGLFAAGAVAAALLLVLPQRQVVSPGLDAAIAAIAATDGTLFLSAALSGDQLQVELLVGAVQPGRVLELWLIPEGAPAPVSLGVLPPNGVADLTVPATLAGALAGGVLAVSDEPPGGSPTGAPTGAVLAMGAITPL